MSWEREIEELRRRKELAKKMGGDENVARHHSQGKLTARERIDRLLDVSTFREIGGLAGSVEYDAKGNLVDFLPSNVVMGTGRIDKRRVVVFGGDFTIRGGPDQTASNEKWIWVERLAMEMRMPLVILVDTAGGSIRLIEEMGATTFPGFPNWNYSYMLGLIPVAAAALGSLAGMGAFHAVYSHFSVMVKEKSQVFAAGPYLVEHATGEKVTKEELGGYRIHSRGSGVIDNEADDEEDAIMQIKCFLSYLPRNVYEVPPRKEPDDDPDRREEELLALMPRDRRKTYDARKILGLVFDKGSLFEIGRYNGKSQIAMLGRLNGYPVGVMANDVRFFGGGMDETAAEKVIRFVDMCDTFHLPMVNFVDQPGVILGTLAEKRGTVRKGVRVMAAITQSRIPWVAIILRRAFGAAGSVAGRAYDINIRYAWPSGYWGTLPMEGGVEAAYKREIQSAEDPAALLQQLNERYERLMSPFRTAERFGIQDIIDPRDTRSILCDWVEQAYDVLPQQLGPINRPMRP